MGSQMGSDLFLCDLPWSETSPRGARARASARRRTRECCVCCGGDCGSVYSSPAAATSGREARFVVNSGPVQRLHLCLPSARNRTDRAGTRIGKVVAETECCRTRRENEDKAGSNDACRTGGGGGCYPILGGVLLNPEPNPLNPNPKSQSLKQLKTTNAEPKLLNPTSQIQKPQPCRGSLRTAWPDRFAAFAAPAVRVYDVHDHPRRPRRG